MLFEKECLKKKESISEHDYEALFINQEALNLEELIAQCVMAEEERPFEDFANRTQATLNTSKILKNATSTYKGSFTKTYQPLIEMRGVRNAFVLSILPKRTDDYFREFNVRLSFEE